MVLNAYASILDTSSKLKDVPYRQTDRHTAKQEAQWHHHIHHHINSWFGDQWMSRGVRGFGH